MDFFSALTLFIILFLIFSLCGFCCRRKQKGTIFSTPVVVTSATHTAPGVYPTGMQTVAVYPASSGSNYQQSVYPQQAPYPVGAQMGMPMPQGQMPPMGINQPMGAPYPPAGPGLNPPSYESAVNPNVPAANSSQPGYEKQSPYNPNYSTAY